MEMERIHPCPQYLIQDLGSVPPNVTADLKEVGAPGQPNDSAHGHCPGFRAHNTLCPHCLPSCQCLWSFFWWQSHSKASESYAVSRAWNCLLKLSAEGKFTAVGALREKHGKGLPETASSAVTGCLLRSPFTTLRGWEVPDTDVEACPYSCWWPWIFPEI